MQHSSTRQRRRDLVGRCCVCIPNLTSIQGTGPGHESAKPAESTFKTAPVVTDAPVVTGVDVNNKSHGTDSHAGAAGADGNIEVSGGAPTGNTD